MLHEIPDVSGYRRADKAADAGMFAMNCSRMFKVHGKVFWNDDLVDAVTLVAMSGAGSEDGTADPVEVLSGLCDEHNAVSGRIVSAMTEAGLPANEAMLREMVSAAEAGRPMPGSDSSEGWAAILGADAVLLVATGIAVDAMRLVDDSSHEPITRVGRMFDGIFPQYRAEPEELPVPGC